MNREHVPRTEGPHQQPLPLLLAVRDDDLRVVHLRHGSDIHDHGARDIREHRQRVGVDRRGGGRG